MEVVGGGGGSVVRLVKAVVMLICRWNRIRLVELEMGEFGG